MEIRSSIKSEGLTGRIGGDCQGGAGGDPLAQLCQRVSDTLSQGPGAEQGKISVDNQQVRQGLCSLGQSLPGMGCDTVC